jgi:hypothetical protein
MREGEKERKSFSWSAQNGHLNLSKLLIDAGSKVTQHK